MAKAKVMGDLGEMLSKVGKETGDMITKSFNGQKYNGTLKAINHIGNNYMGGLEMAGRVLKNKETFSDALSATFKENGKLNYGKIAGSYIGVSAAARIATGGGAYKDRNGNTNIAGVPFI